MGAFSTKTVLNGRPSLIPAIADRICQEFLADGYEINREKLISGGVDISVTKGGLFKAILGMKTALKVTLIPQDNSISFEAGVGIFGQQVIPTLIMLFVTWPVLLTQIWGLVQQSKLDDKALAAAQAVVRENVVASCGAGYSSAAAVSVSEAPKFCTNCGASLPVNANFCSYCGTSIK